MLEKSFGTKNLNETYIERVGAYGIIFNSENQIAVVHTSSGYFLLGGGVEEGETYEECIKRECLEEAGLCVSVGDFICKGDSYLWSNGLKHYLHAIGYFYFADYMEQLALKAEDDHKLVWLGVEDGCHKLFLQHQAWALKLAIRLRNNIGVSGRFIDKGESVYTFLNKVLVKCPVCHKCAFGFFEFRKPAKTLCPKCGFTKIWSTGAIGNGHFGGEDLWLKMECCSETLWAYNKDHLIFLEQFIQATLRERQLNITQSLASRLPMWMKKSSNREKLLKCIQKLKEKLEEI